MCLHYNAKVDLYNIVPTTPEQLLPSSLTLTKLNTSSSHDQVKDIWHIHSSITLTVIDDTVYNMGLIAELTGKIKTTIQA